MAVTLNWTADQLFAVVKPYFETLLSVPVVRGQGNRVPLPAGLGADFVIITPLFQSMLAQPVSAYDDLTVRVSVGMQWNLQFDFVGPNSQALSAIAMVPWRTPWGCDQITGISPLYTGDAIQSPLIGGEDQFEEKWRVDAAIEYVAMMTLEQQSALTLEIGLKSVDAFYPPSE